MPGYAHISVSIHMTTHTAVLIDTIKDLRSELHWCYCNIFYTQEQAVDVITHDEYASVFSWKGESIKE